jgi:hypothetical protein
LQILSRYPLSLPELWKESKLNEINSKDRRFLSLIKHTESLMRRLGERGGAISLEMNEVVEDIWFLKEDDGESYLKKLRVLRLFYLILFFVLPYMIFNFLFFSSQWGGGDF